MNFSYAVEFQEERNFLSIFENGYCCQVLSQVLKISRIYAK